MKVLNQLFVNYLKKKHNVKVDTKNVAWEAIEMYHDEIDLELFPQHILETLPDPLLILMASYLGEGNQEWIFCVATEVHSPYKWLHALCLVDGELVDVNVPLKLD